MSMLNFDYDECKVLFHRTLIDVLSEQSTRIRELHNSEDIWALSYDIIPWQPFAAVSFRVREESQGVQRYDVAGWKHYGFSENIDTSALEEVAKYSAGVLQNADVDKNGGPSSQDLPHLMYLAAAESLLMDDVASILKSLGINAPCWSESLEPSYFEYIVFDDDKTLQANYCEIIRANRVTQRLLGRTI